MSASVALRHAGQTEQDIQTQNRPCNTKMAGCVNPSECDTEQSQKTRPLHSAAMLPPCRICGEKASGFHYGANTCEACKGFFKRSLKRKATFMCAYDDNCDTRASKRTVCNACRYKKCTDVGMSKSAIKTGRYKYENKTKIIKEVKQLELARLAALPTQPSSDNVVALSKLPQQITDNKYELVIEQILAAYQEHPMFGTNFDADMKQSEETYLEEKRMTECMFGSMKPISTEEHIKIYQSTGIDVDGRLKNIVQTMPIIDKGTRCSIEFVKALPGFKSLSMEDKVSVIKKSRFELYFMMGHKNVNHEHKLITFFWGETMDYDKMTICHSEELVDAMFSLSSRFEKLHLSHTETLILSCIAVFFPDRCQLECPEKVEEIQHLLMETLSYFHKRMYPDEPHRLARCLILFPELRSAAAMFLKEKAHFVRMWSKTLTFPPLLRELCQHE